MSVFLVITGLVSSLATLGALYFAWKTVDGARKAEGERRLNRIAEQLEDLIEVVTELRLANRAGPNTTLAEAHQDRLRALVAATPLRLENTRALTTATFTLDNYPQNETVATAALEESRVQIQGVAERMGTVEALSAINN